MPLPNVLKPQENSSNKRKLNECKKNSKKSKTVSTNSSDSDVSMDNGDTNDEEIIDDSCSEIKSSNLNDISSCDKQTINTEIVCPKYGQIVNRRKFRRAGNKCYIVCNLIANNLNI